MKHYRTQRVGDQITREISLILRLKVSDPRLQDVTITGTRVTKDLRLAYVYYSILGSNEVSDDVVQGLEKAMGFIRRELGNRMDIRHVPELNFEFDQSLQHGNKIWEQLASLNSADDPSGDDPSDIE